MATPPRRTDHDEMDDWIAVVDRLPFVSSIKRDVTALRKLLYDRRAPRIAVVGLPASGRTSLANGLLSAMAFGPDGAMPSPEVGRWVQIDAGGRRLDWLELPAERERDELRELARRAFDETRPDLLIALVEAHAEETSGPKVRDAVETLLAVARDGGEKPAVLVLLSKVDALPPAGAGFDEKRPAIDHALGALRRHFADLGQPDDAFLALCARPLGAGDGAQDAARWNVDAVGEAILERLPEPAQMEAARAFEVGREARRRVGRMLVNSSSALAVTVGLAPIPFADAFLLLPLQAAMVTGVAYLSGRPWDRKAGAEWLASVGVVGGAGFGLRWGAQQLVKLIPGAGSLVGAGVAGAGTLAIGRSAIAYFIDGPGSLPKRPVLKAEN